MQFIKQNFPIVKYSQHSENLLDYKPKNGKFYAIRRKFLYHFAGNFISLGNS